MLRVSTCIVCWRISICIGSLAVKTLICQKEGRGEWLGEHLPPSETLVWPDPCWDWSQENLGFHCWWWPSLQNQEQSLNPSRGQAGTGSKSTAALVWKRWVRTWWSSDVSIIIRNSSHQAVFVLNCHLPHQDCPCPPSLLVDPWMIWSILEIVSRCQYHH